MKKSLIALSVAAGMFGVAHADSTNLYGSLGYSIKVDNNEGVKSIGNTFKENVWDLATSTAKFGIKGDEDLSNGIQVFFKFEFGVDASSDRKKFKVTDEDGNEHKLEREGLQGVNKTNYAYLGFKGDTLGTVTLGYQKSLWKTVMDVNNFNDVFTAAAKFKDAPGKIDKAISYVSPSFGGFKFAGAIQLDGNNFASKGVDVYEAAAMYENYGVEAGLVYSNLKERLDTGKKDTTEFMGLNVGYKMDDTFSANFGAGHRSSAGERYNLQGEYFLGANTFRAGVNYADNEKGSPDPLTVALGYQYNFSKRTYVWLEGEYTDHDVPKSPEHEGYGYQVFVGARHDF